jgi:hypothetical protein
MSAQKLLRQCRINVNIFTLTTGKAAQIRSIWSCASYDLTQHEDTIHNVFEISGSNSLNVGKLKTKNNLISLL